MRIIYVLQYNKETKYYILYYILYNKEKQTVTSKNKGKTERIFLELGSKLFNVVTQIFYSQEIYALKHKHRQRIFFKTKNLIKLLDPYKTRRDYIQHAITIN